MDANIDPLDDATQYFFYDLESGREKLNDFYTQFRGLTRSPPIGKIRRLLRRDELVNVDLLYRTCRVRLKIRACDLYIIGFCLCLINGTRYEIAVHEFRKENETRYLKDSVAMNVSSSYPDLKLNVRKFGYRTVTNAITSLRNPPTPQPSGDYMKEQVVEFMILVCEGGRFLPIGNLFHENFQLYRTIKLDAKFTDLINDWGRYSKHAREVRKGSILDKSYDQDVKRLDKTLFENPDTRGVAAEQLICIKCVEEQDFDSTGRFVYQRNPGVEPDEGPSAGQNPAHRGSADKPTGHGSGRKAKGSASGHGPQGSGSTQKPVGKKRPADQIVCHSDVKKFCCPTGVEVAVTYDGGPRYNQRLASDFLSNYIFLSFERVGSATDLIIQTVVFVEDMQSHEYLRNLPYEQKANGYLGKNASTSIFVETKRSADLLKRWLHRMGFPAIAIHGDKVRSEREQALRSFKLPVAPILVAIDVASRALDTPRVTHVIGFDLPRDIDVHIIGRTGRAGKSGLATAFFNDKNSCIAKALLELMNEAHQEAPDWLNLLLVYAKTRNSDYAVASDGHGYFASQPVAVEFGGSSE